MPLFLAALLYGGSFVGYTAVQSGGAGKAAHYLNSPVQHPRHVWCDLRLAVKHTNKPWLAVSR